LAGYLPIPPVARATIIAKHIVQPVMDRKVEYPSKEQGSMRWIQVLSIAVMLLAVALPFALRVLPVLIALVGLAVVVLRWKQGRGEWPTLSLASVWPWMALFYLVHLMGMGWTTNTDFGSFDLEVKVAFLLFPLMFWLLPRNIQFQPAKAWLAFAWSSAASVLVCLLAAGWRFGHEWYLRGQGLLPEDPAWTNHFFESRFALFLHPSYMAMYLCFALATVQHVGLRDSLASWVKWTVPGLLVLGVILCNSKMGWLTMAMVIGVAMLKEWKDVGSRNRLILLSGVGLGLFLALFLAFPTVSGKLTQAISATGAIDPASDQSSALRRMVWDAASDLVRKHPLTGVGTGDIKDELIAVYQEKGYVHAEAKRMNAHSQFLQTTAALGLTGLVSLLLMLLLPLVMSWRARDGLAFVFFLIVILNWVVESMAEVQAGVVFFTFFAWLLKARTNAES
jgi:O-antigen ligase